MMLQRIATIFLSAVFVIAGGLKIFDPAGMLGAIQAFRVVDGPLALAGAYVFPWLELFAGLALLMRPTRAAGAFILLGLMVLFIGVILSAWARGLSLSCGCFGAHPAGEVDNYWVLLIRDLALVVLAGYVLRGAFVDSTKKADLV